MSSFDRCVGSVCVTGMADLPGHLSTSYRRTVLQNAMYACKLLGDCNTHVTDVACS